MRDKEILDLANAYKKICEQQVGVPIPAGKSAEDVLKPLIKKHGGGEVVEPKKTTLQKAHYEPQGELVDEEIDVYDEVLEYLLSEGYSLEESNQIMVELISESGLGSLLKGAAKFVQRRASTPLKTAVTDLATTAIASGSAPAAKLSTATAKSAAPSAIVRTVKAPTMRTAPRGANKITTNVWNEPTAPSSRINPSKPSGPKVSSTRALSGTPSRPALPSAGQTSAKPTYKPGAQPKTPKTAEPGGALVSTRAPKPTYKPGAQPKTPKTAEPGGALVSTRAPKPTKTGLSPEGQAIQRLNRMTGGGPLGTRELSQPAHRAPKPAWGSEAKPTSAKPAAKPATAKPAVSPQSTVDKAITQTSSKPSVKPAAKPSGGGAGSSGRLRGLAGPAALGAALGVATDMAFPRSTAPGTHDKAPKLPTSAKEVKKGETYYDPSTRVGDSQRFAQRKKVGPKIVGPGKVGTEAQSFDKAYGAAKAKSGMGSTFTWKGKSYKVY